MNRAGHGETSHDPVKTALRTLALTILFAGTSLHAAEPLWWRSAATGIFVPNAPSDNYAPANLGQLKHVAAQAKRHLDLELQAVGGAGPAIDALVASFESHPGQTYPPAELAALKAANYAPINLGQLKAVAKVFYTRLIDVGYDTRQNLIDHDYPVTWLHAFPWNPNDPWNQPAPGDKTPNYAPANLGQLKLVFSFDLSGQVAPEARPT